MTPPPGKLPLPIEVIVPTTDQEGQVLSSSARQDNNQEAGTSDSVLGTGAEVTAQTVETESTSTAPILTVEPTDPLPIGIFEAPTTTSEAIATSTDPIVSPDPILVEPIVSIDDVASTTDQANLSLETPTPDAAPSASDHVTYYIDKYYEKEWNGVARNHYFLGNINLAVEPLSGSNSGIYYTLSDHLGSSSLTTNSYGNMIDRTEYTPYGAIVATAATQDIGNKYKFTGKELDGETNLSYFGARYYNQTIGYFVSIDPYNLNVDKLTKVLSDPQKLHSYLYSRGNPVVLVDPDGNSDVDFAIGLTVGAGVRAYQTGLAIMQPVDTLKSIGNLLAEGYKQGRELGGNISRNPGQTLNEIGTGLKIQTQEFLAADDYTQGKAVGGVAFDTALVLESGVKSGDLSFYKQGSSVGIKGERFAVSADYMKGAEGVGTSIRDLTKSVKYRDTRLIAADFHDIRVLGKEFKLPHIDITIGKVSIKHFPWNIIDKLKK